MAEGFFSGFIEGEQAQKSNVAFGLDVQQKQLGLQEGQQKLLIGGQTMQENDIKIKTADIALKAQQRLLSILSSKDSTGQSTPTTAAHSIADDLDFVGKAQQEAGMFEAAGHSFNNASLIRERQSAIDERNDAIQRRNLAIVSNEMDRKTVTSQAAFTRAIQNIEMITGHPYKGDRNYSPQLVEALYNASMTSKTKQEIATAKAREMDSYAAAKEHAARIPLIQAQEENAKERTKNLEKAGGKTLVPKSSDIQAITDLMADDFGGSGAVDPSLARTLARPVAESAMQKVSDGKPRAQAYKEAYDQAVRDGHFAGLKPGKQPPGSSAADPSPLPTKVEQMKDNQWYILKDGTKAVWSASKKGFVVPQGEVAGESTDDDDETDDE